MIQKVYWIICVYKCLFGNIFVISSILPFSDDCKRLFLQCFNHEALGIKKILIYKFIFDFQLHFFDYAINVTVCWKTYKKEKITIKWIELKFIMNLEYRNNITTAFSVSK